MTNKIWDAVDWTLQNVVIADQVGRSRERVRQVREQRGEGKPARYNRPRSKGKTECAAEWLRDNMQWSGLLCVDDVCAIHSISKRSVFDAVADSGFLLFNTHARAFSLGWPINWDLPNIDIARIWFATDTPTWSQQVNVAVRRKGLGKGRAKWDNRFGHTNGEPGRQQLFDAEVEKRKVWLRDAWRETPNRIACSAA